MLLKGSFMKEKFFADLGISQPSVLDLEIEKIISKTLASRLTPTEQYIISSYYGIETELKKYDEIGVTVTLSAFKVRQINVRSIRKLRWPSVRSSLVKSIEEYVANKLRFVNI